MTETVAGLLAAVAAAGPARTAVLVPETGRRLTYSELDRRSRQVAAGLAALGVEHGDRIALWLPNLPEALVLQFAAGRLGAVVVGVNTRFRSAELDAILAAAEPACLVMAQGFRDIDFAGILAETDRRPPLVVGVGSDVPEGARPWSSLFDHGSLDAELGTAYDVCNLFSTSGSTGIPKLATHRQASVVAHARNDATAFAMGPDDVSLCALPLCGVFGFNAVMSALAAGSTVLLPAAFDAAEAAHAIDEHRVTHWHAADGMMRGVLDVAAAEGLSLRSWREGAYAAFAGGGPDLVREIEESVGARVTGVYGASEVFALLARWAREWDPDRRGVCGGIPVSPDLQVRAVHPESGEVLPHGEPGELQFRGYTVTSGYHGNPSATAAAFTPDGWYRSGDLGSTRDDGGFLYLSRLKDSLRLRGFLTDPAEIEVQLQQHPAVLLAQVVGVSGPDGGDVAVAFVELEPGAAATATSAELVDHCRRALANYKVPAAVHVVDEWPTVSGPNGVKIQKMRLRDRAAGLL